MAAKNGDTGAITFTVEEVENGRRSRYMELESQEIRMGQSREPIHTSSSLSQHALGQQQSLTHIIRSTTSESSSANLARSHDVAVEPCAPSTTTSPAQTREAAISAVHATNGQSNITTTVEHVQMCSLIQSRSAQSHTITETQTTTTRQDQQGDRLTHQQQQQQQQQQLQEQRSGSELQQPEHDRKRDSTHILERFEEEAKSFQEQMLLLPSKPKRARAPSPSPFRQSVGLDHLDNLVRLMEQLTQLRDENTKLKKRCEYLENTKSLLQMRTMIVGPDTMVSGVEEPLPLGYLSLPAKTRPKQERMSEEVNGDLRPRLASAEDSQYVEIDVEMSEDKLTNEELEPLKRFHKRSYSTGSIDVPDGVMSADLPVLTSNGGNGSKNNHEHLLEMSQNSAKHKKMSKWAKVKKVFTGHRPSDHGEPDGTDVHMSRKDEHEQVERRITLAMRNNGASHEAVDKHLLATPHIGLSQSRSVDSGVGSGLESTDLLRMSTSSAEPASPSRKLVHSGYSQLDESEDLTGDMWMIPPGWEDCRAKRQGSFPSEEGSSADGKSSRAHSAKEGKEKSQYLQVQTRYPYVRRSSSLEGLEDLQKHSLEEVQVDRLHRSASTKSDGKSPSPETEASHLSKEKKLHKSAWGRVKDIIHTRKDSLKKKRTTKGDKSDSEISEGIEYSDFIAEMGNTAEGKVSPKGSTTGRNGRNSISHAADSPPKQSPRLKSSGSEGSPGVHHGGLLVPSASQAGLNIDIAQLMGAMTEEYTKKMQEWEEKKNRKSIASRGSVSPAKGKERDHSREGTPEGGDTPLESPWHSLNVDDIQRNLTESFNRKLQEWEKIKYRRDVSPLLERKTKASSKKKEERKSKKSKSEKEKEKLDRLREREIHRVEKEVQKLEREKMRLEKERLKALEKEAKIEKMKCRLNQADIATKLTHPILGPLSEYKVTSEFARKLHEWEVKKGLSQEASTALYLEIQKRSLELTAEMYHGEPTYMYKRKWARGTQRESISDLELELEPPSPSRSPTDEQFVPLTEETFTESTGDVQTVSEVELERQLSEELSVATDDQDGSSSVTDERVVNININSLEKANASLMEELRKKETEYMNTQLEVHSLNEKLASMKDSHTLAMATLQEEAATLQRQQQLQQSSGESNGGQVSLTDLEGKIEELETFGDRIILSMESAAICKFQSMEGEEAVGCQLVELVGQMKVMLAKVSQTEEASKRSSMMHDFEKLYSHAMQLQVQMNNLRLSHLERNKEIMDLKRQLLLQEVTNLLLQVDITRRETELTHYKESKQRSLNRSNTYSGTDESEDMTEGKECTAKPPLQRFISLKESLGFESPEMEEDRSPKSPLEGDVSREHTLDVFFPLDSQARSSTTSADSTEFSSTKSGDSVSDDPFVASLPASDSVEMLPPDIQLVSVPEMIEICEVPELAITTIRDINNIPVVRETAVLPVLKLLPVPASKAKYQDVNTVQQEVVVLAADSEQPEAVSTVKPCESTAEIVAGATIEVPVVELAPVEEVQITSTSYSEIPSSHLDRTTRILDLPSSSMTFPVDIKNTDGKKADIVIPAHVKSSQTPHHQTGKLEVIEKTESVKSSVSGKQIVLTQPAKLRTESERIKKYSQPSRLYTRPDRAQTYQIQRVAKSEYSTHSSSVLQGRPPRGERLSEWLKREPKLPTLVIPDYKNVVCKEGEKPPLEKISAVEGAIREEVPLHVLREQVLLGPVIDGGRHHSPQSLTGLPPCPIIHSRQTRHLKGERKIQQQQQQHTSSDLARLPATPPRNNHRHRMCKRERNIEEEENGRRSMYVTSDPNLQSSSSAPMSSIELLLIQSQDLDANSKSAPDGLPRSSQSTGHVDTCTQVRKHSDHTKPVSDMISKFEKQASTSESAQATLALRKTPSPTIFIPQVGTVSPIRKLKPAAELLQESQRYKSRGLSSRGHMRRLEAMTQRTQSEENTSSTRSQNKENVSEVSYVQTMVQRLSRETTPERRIASKDSSPRSGSSSGVTRSDSPRSNNEFVTHIVRKLSTATDPDTSLSSQRALSPLKDLTNDGQVKSLMEAFNSGSEQTSPERVAGATSPTVRRAVLAQNTRSTSSSCSPPVMRALYPQLASVSSPVKEGSSVFDKTGLGSHPAPTSMTRSPPPTRAAHFVGLSQPIPYKPDSTISVTCSSLPSSQHHHVPPVFDAPSTSHASHTAPAPSSLTASSSTTSDRPGTIGFTTAQIVSPAQAGSSRNIPKAGRTKKAKIKALPDIEIIEHDVKAAQSPQKNKSPTSPMFKRGLFSKTTSSQGGKKSSAQKPPPGQKSSEKASAAQKPPPGQKYSQKSSGGVGIRGTIGTLCQQAMSFDLGVSLHMSKDKSSHEKVDFRKSDPVKLPSACATQTTPPQSPSTRSDDGGLSPQDLDVEKSKSSKGKSRDHSWLQKSKKLFKVSNSPPRPRTANCVTVDQEKDTVHCVVDNPGC